MAIPTPKQYILDFEQLGFGMFVHWGLYSQIGKGEWYFNQTPELSMDEYATLKDTFTAEDFDAEKMVLVAKNAGCKYITLTTRHHEGFSLYDVCGLNDFDAPHSPAGRDLIREFVDACNKHDIVPFFYHTTWDWYNRDFDENFEEYLEYLRKSVEILCKNYGKIGGFWFDGNWSKPGKNWKEDELYATIRKYQPDAMIINNTGESALGKIGHPEIDAVTFEQGRPTPMNREGMEKYIAAEMCLTLNQHWGIGYRDFNYKTPFELIKSLCACRKVGANFLINIGPEGQGKINPMQEQLMAVLGEWMKLFGEAIYNGRPTNIPCMGESFVLKSIDGKYLYLFMHDVGRKASNNVTARKKYHGAYSFGNVTDKIKSVKWMDSNEELEFICEKNMLSVNFTGQPYGESLPVKVAKAEIEI